MEVTKMSHFISWAQSTKEKDKNGEYEVFFLDHDDAYHTKKGENTREHTRYWKDLCGHGSLFLYYNLNNCSSRECTDFSTPEFFPSKIVKAIKDCKFVGIGYGKLLLNEQAQKVFDKERLKLRRKYKVRKNCSNYDVLNKCFYETTEIFWKMFKIQKNRAELWKDIKKKISKKRAKVALSVN
jgi:hypothetical protein